MRAAWSVARNYRGWSKAMVDINRVEANRALAKAIAFKACGKPLEANEWARKLVRILGAAEILRGES